MAYENSLPSQKELDGEKQIGAAGSSNHIPPGELVDRSYGNAIAGNHSSRDIHGWKWATVYSAMLSTTFLFALDNTIVASIQPAIINDLGHLELLSWIGTGFALGTMFILLWGKIYGAFNMKWIYIFNIFLFEAGSALCGAAPNMTTLIIGRVIAGIGGSGMYSGTLTYVSVLSNDQEKPAYLAGSTVVWGIGSVLGPVVGGAFAASTATWRWGFYVNLPIGATFAPVYFLLFPNFGPYSSKTLMEKLCLVDWVNAIIFLAGSACLTVALTFGGVVYPFTSVPVITLWTTAGILLVAFISLLKLHPLVAKENRLYPLHFLKQPTLMNMQLQVFLASGIILAMIYYIPLYFQFIKGDSALEAGVRILPLIMSMISASMVNGFLMPRYGLIPVWYIGGSLLALIGASLMCRTPQNSALRVATAQLTSIADTVDHSTNNAKVYGYNILIGAGTGSYVVAGFAIMQSLVPVQEISNAVSAMTISQDLGMVLFLAVSGSLFHNEAVDKVGKVLPDVSQTEIENLVAGSSSKAFQALSEMEKILVIPEIDSAISTVWAFLLSAAALSVVCSLPLLKVKVDRGEELAAATVA
uniref:CpaN1 MFS transporter n=1 Tax=Curvularia pallescens TaxID=318706 RepID=A0A218PFY1_9PLEO|nr:cpaN1 MFS transporter [Curvularia pallescens]